jgi:hypothetical protein
MAGETPQNLVKATEMIYAKYSEAVRNKPGIENRQQEYLEKFRKSLMAGQP